MQGDDHADVVARVKGALIGRGVDLTGPCGAFAITKRVAWELRGEGAGLLSKPAGNNCEGYSVDYIVYRNGQGFDMLGDAGGANTPGWSDNGIDPSFPDRWRPPFDPGDVPAPAPAPGPTPTPGPTPDDDVDPVEELIVAVERIVTGLEHVAVAVDLLAGKVASLETNGVRMKFK